MRIAAGWSGAMKRGIVIVGALGLLVMSLAVYFYVGSEHVDVACTANPPGSKPWRTASYGWSWSPPGFECIHDGTRQWTSLWH